MKSVPRISTGGPRGPLRTELSPRDGLNVHTYNNVPALFYCAIINLFKYSESIESI